jgi:hypothetical protein
MFSSLYVLCRCVHTIYISGSSLQFIIFIIIIIIIIIINVVFIFIVCILLREYTNNDRYVGKYKIIRTFAITPF